MQHRKAVRNKYILPPVIVTPLSHTYPTTPVLCSTHCQLPYTKRPTMDVKCHTNVGNPFISVICEQTKFYLPGHVIVAKSRMIGILKNRTNVFEGYYWNESYRNMVGIDWVNPAKSRSRRLVVLITGMRLRIQ
jgi:hypothetical protein